MPRDQFNEPITRQILLADGTSVLQPLDNILVTVYRINEDGTRQGAPATIYATRGPADNTAFAAGNPFVTGANGKTGFWAANGDYDIVLHDQNAIPRIGDQSFGWQANAGGDQGLSKLQLPEYGRGLNPPGALLGFAGTGDPPGWLLCDGRVVPQVGTYAGLYAAIGLVYGLGNEGAGNFRIPDYRGRSLIGLDDMGTGQGAAGRLTSVLAANRARGKSGGTDSEVLAANHLPAHVHNLVINSSVTGVSVNSVGDHTHEMAFTRFFDYAQAVPASRAALDHQGSPDLGFLSYGGGAHGHSITDNGHAHTGSVNDTGQTRGAAHNNLHNYQISNVIIKI